MQLENAGYIQSEVIDDITYYYATIKSDEFIKSKTPLDLLKTATSAIIDKVLQNV